MSVLIPISIILLAVACIGNSLALFIHMRGHR